MTRKAVLGQDTRRFGVSVLPKEAHHTPRSSPATSDLESSHNSEGPSLPSSSVRCLSSRPSLRCTVSSEKRDADSDEAKERVYDTKDLQRLMIARRDELKNIPPKSAVYEAHAALYEPYVYSAESELTLLGYRAEWNAWKAHKAAKGRTVMLPFNTDTQVCPSASASASASPRVPASPRPSSSRFVCSS